MTARAPAAARRLAPAPAAASGPPRKLADLAADRIVADVAERSWPVGEVLGSEAALLERYGLSRAVFREAVRIVEQLQIARMRRGPGGGLVVAEPSLDAVTTAVLVRLLRQQPDFEELVEARFVIEDLTVQLAADRAGPDAIARLRHLSHREAGAPPRDRELHRLLATLAENPALELFVDLLNDVALLYLPDLTAVGETSLREAWRAHQAIIAAIAEGDAPRARRRMRRHLETEATWFRARRPQRLWPVPTPAQRPGAKRGELLAGELLAEIVSSGWVVGSFVGSEPELMAAHGASRATLREAVRLLEHHQVVAMRRGPGGGMFVTEPSESAVTGAAAVYLERRGLSVLHLLELRPAVEVALVEGAIARLDEPGADRLRAAVETEGEAPDAVFPDVVHDLHTVVAALAGNAFLELFAGVLVRLTRLHQPTPGGPGTPLRRGIIDTVHRSHAAIVEAIVARDPVRAGRELTDHLADLAGFLT